MRGFNFNISSLFSGLGNKDSFGSVNLSDYASIKNGSYGKLMKSYYAEQKKDTSLDKTKADKNKKNQQVDTTGLTQIKKESDSLKNSVEALAKDDLWKIGNGGYNTDKIYDAVKNFANDYNDVIDQSGKVNSKDISQSMKYMRSMTDTMSKALSKVGITVGTDGKLSIDEEAFKKSNMGSVKSLFSGTTSYASQTADKASEISKAALMGSSIYSNNGALSSSLSNMFNNWV